MGKPKTTEPTVPKAPKAPKTIKVSTLVTCGIILLGLIASFIGGIVVSNHYASTVHAEAVKISLTLK